MQMRVCQLAHMLVKAAHIEASRNLSAAKLAGPPAAQSKGHFGACMNVTLNGEKLFSVISTTYPKEPPARIQ